MEESDEMLISSIRDFIDLPPSIQTIRDIKTDEIYHLACLIMEALKIDYSELKKINRTQRFRSMTKLTQTINKELDTDIEMNDIMNPTLPFLRKLLLTFISRLGVAEGERSKLSLPGAQENNVNRNQREALKKWIQSEYICPELRVDEAKPKYEPFRLKLEMNKNLFKRDICPELANVAGNTPSILRTLIAREQLEIKKREAEEGINRKKLEELQRKGALIGRNNHKDWAGADKAIGKMKKNMLQAAKAEDQVGHSQDASEKAASVFQREVEVLAEQHQTRHRKEEVSETRASEISAHEQLPEDPLERIKKECDNKRNQLEVQLQEILQALSEKKDNIEDRERMKRELEEQMQQFEDRAASEKQARHELKKKAERQKMMLDSLEGGMDLQGEVKELQEEVEYLEKEAQKQIDSMLGDIGRLKSEGERKLQLLGDLKLKLNKIEADYHNIVEEIEEKKEVKARVKINKSGLSRIYYSKKITEMEVRWRETQKETSKISAVVGSTRQEIRRSALTATRIETEIDNMVNSGKLKNENENIACKDIFNRCKKTFQLTMEAIEQINDTKKQIQEYEMKVHILAGKDYKENIRKLQGALQDLKKEMSQIQKA